MDDSINLPFEAKLLVPFIVAFRAAPSCLDDRARFEHIAQVMRRHDSTFTSALAKAAAEALALSLDDLMQKVELGRDVHGPVDRVCVCCGSREMVTMFNRSSTVYSLDACKEVEVVSRQCKWCTTTHSVNEVSTLPAVLVISHPELMKVRGLKAQLEATLGPDCVAMPRQRLRLDPGEVRDEPAAPIGPPPPSAPPSLASCALLPLPRCAREERGRRILYVRTQEREDGRQEG